MAKQERELNFMDAFLLLNVFRRDGSFSMILMAPQWVILVYEPNSHHFRVCCPALNRVGYFQDWPFSRLLA